MKNPARAVVLATTPLLLTACGSSGGEGGSTPASTHSKSVSSTPKPLPFNASGLLGGDAHPNFPNTESFNTAPLKVTEANLSGDAVVGSATNKTGASTDGPYEVPVYCFDGDKLLRYTGGFAEQDGPIKAGGKATFTVDLLGEKCPTFAVGVSGYF